MVHYYQPNHPLLYLQVNITNGPVEQDAVAERGDQGVAAPIPNLLVPDLPVYEAVLPLPTCTASQGCRSAVLKDSADKEPGHFRITEEFDIKFMNNGPDGAWIEYVMAVPSSDFTPSLLQPDDSVDQAERFIKECGQDHFFVPDNLDKEDFCRASITSISADFNERALQCECNIEGAINHHQVGTFASFKTEILKKLLHEHTSSRSNRKGQFFSSVQQLWRSVPVQAPRDRTKVWKVIEILFKSRLGWSVLTHTCPREKAEKHWRFF